MKRSRLTAVLAAGAMALGALQIAPQPAGASEYCTKVFIVSGLEPEAAGQKVAGANAGSVGCQFDAITPVANTNYLTPGATHAWVIALTGAARPTGTLGDTTLSFYYNDVRGRWESSSVSVAHVASGDSITATVTGTTGTYSVTYTRA